MFDSLLSLQNLAHIEVELKGDWTAPYYGNSIWQGEAIADTPIVGMIFANCANQIFWAKSRVTSSNRVPLSLMVHPTMGSKVQLIVNFGIEKATATLNDKDHLPDIPQTRTFQTGSPVLFASFDAISLAELYLLCLDKRDVKVARKHIWGLRKDLRVGLSDPWLKIFSRGRRGQFLA